VWDNPAAWGVTLGREKYGVAGSITVFPPAVPLKVAGTFREGDRLTWQDLVLEVIPLPGHGRYQVGFVLELTGKPLAILKSYRQMISEPVDLNLGGHGSHFGECAALYAESLRRVEHALPCLRRLIPGGDLEAAFFRPGQPRWPGTAAKSASNPASTGGSR